MSMKNYEIWRANMFNIRASEPLKSGYGDKNINCPKCNSTNFFMDMDGQTDLEGYVDYEEWFWCVDCEFEANSRMELEEIKNG